MVFDTRQQCGFTDHDLDESIMTETEARLNSHEAVCAERYEQINARLKRLERILMSSAGVLICGMASIVWQSLHLAK